MSSTPSRCEQLQSAPNEPIEAEEACTIAYVAGRTTYVLPKKASGLESVTIEHQVASPPQAFAGAGGVQNFKLYNAVANPTALQDDQGNVYTDFTVTASTQTYWSDGAGLAVTLQWSIQDQAKDLPFPAPTGQVACLYQALQALDGAKLTIDSNGIDLSGCDLTHVSGTQLKVLYKTKVRKLLNNGN